MNEGDLRDFFAAQALTAVIADWTRDWDIFQDADVAECIARDAYIVADAMMREREKK
jgi:hypothetical protein